MAISQRAEATNTAQCVLLNSLIEFFLSESDIKEECSSRGSLSAPFEWIHDSSKMAVNDELRIASFFYIHNKFMAIEKKHTD